MEHEIDEQQEDHNSDTPATETHEDAPTVTSPDEPASLADAMWGTDADADTVITEESEVAAVEDATKTKAVEPEVEPAVEATEEVSDDDLVKGLSEKAQKRFRDLVNSNKDIERRLSGFQEVISDSKVTPQDMVDLLSYGKAIRTGNFDQARAILAEQARQLELASGKAVELGDPLSDYPDLKNGVDDMELTRDHALELARVRRTNQVMQHQQDREQRNNETQNVQTKAIQQGFSDVQGLAVTWAKSDLDWASKEPMLVKRAGQIQQNYPPHQWGAMARIAYDEITDTLKTARPATQRRDPSPLRPNAIGGGAKEPANLHEAMWGSQAE